MSEPTEGHVVQGHAAGDDRGEATYVDSIVGRAASRGGKPGATTVLDTESAKIVAFEFAAGDELTEHAARHPVLIRVERGRVEFATQGRRYGLVPGQVLHLTPMLRHAVRADEPATLTVTMLLPHSAS